MEDKGLLLEDNIKIIIADALYFNNLITEDLYLKCGGKPHISNLPYDNRTNDTEKLRVRQEAILDNISSYNSTLKDVEDNLTELEDNHTEIKKEYNDTVARVEESKEEVNESSRIIRESIESSQESMDNLTENLSNTRFGSKMDTLNQLLNGEIDLEDVEYESNDEEYEGILLKYWMNLQESWGDISSNLNDYLSGSGEVDISKMIKFSTTIDEMYNFMEQRHKASEDDEMCGILLKFKDNFNLSDLYQNDLKLRTKYDYDHNSEGFLLQQLNNLDKDIKANKREKTRIERIISDLQVELGKIDL